MTETRVPVQVVMVDRTCEKCGTGLMRPTGMMLPSQPPWYVHRCNGCDAHANFNVSYPHYEYVEVEN